MFPDNLLYTESHEWVAVDGTTARIGITEHAQEELGDIVFVELPEMGDAVGQSDELAIVESVKAVSEIYSPVSGEITSVNEELTDKPELMNSDPYGEGYLCEIELDDPSELEVLMDSGAYEEFIEEEA